MTQSVYIIGGAGTGKSTFTGQLLEHLGEMGEQVNIHTKKVARNTVVLRGHEIAGAQGLGLYLGLMRESFPGTDGLDRVSSPVGVDWLAGEHLPDFILAEGATLATRPFITALSMASDLLLVHLRADDFVKELRFKQRGSEQPASFVQATATRSLNLYNDMNKAGVQTADIDTADPVAWIWAKATCLAHLER